MIFVAEFLVWWFDEGRDMNADDPLGGSDWLKSFAEEAVITLGGWKAARRVLKSE